jgi:hypothetical protein
VSALILDSGVSALILDSGERVPPEAVRHIDWKLREIRLERRG